MMRLSKRILVFVFVFATMGTACGSSDSTTPVTTPDSGTVGQPDALAAPSPFVPPAVDNVINTLAAECEAKGLTAAQKPPIAVMLKVLDGFFQPIVIGANRMSNRLNTLSAVEAPFDPNADKTAPDALDKAGALQAQYIGGYVTNKLYRGMALAPHVAAGDLLTQVNAFVNTCGAVVTIDSDMTTSARSYLVATSNYQAGATAAKKLLEVVKPGESVLVFGTTLEAWASGIERAQGAIDTLTAAGIIVAPKVSPVWVPATDTQNLITALSDTTYNFTGMVCMYSNSFDCAAAVEALNKKDLIKIVGFDMETDTKTYFDKGYFYGIAVQRQYYMGQLGVLVPYAIDVLGPARTAELLAPILVNAWFIDTGIDIITTDNYAAYMSFLSELGINT
jgi:ABC-type sugar transport system substrate-binding protein